MPKVNKTPKQVKMVSGEGYCRKCQKTMPFTKFYEATNIKLDSNGYMSICKDDCNDIYNTYFSIYNNIETALQLTCQDLDVRFSQEALKQCQSQIEKLLSQGKRAETVFGYYKSKLGSTGKNNDGVLNLRYRDSDAINANDIKNKNNQNQDVDVDNDLFLFWGKGFSLDDYIFLETEISNWKQTHKCDNQAEVTLLREICIKILSIRNKRETNENVSGDLKELQDLMKTASVDPAKANTASAGKSHDCFGLWVKDIEQFRPAEWYEQQEKYKDIDGFIPYIKNYIVRPIANFLSGTRNFLINDNVDVDLDNIDSNNEGDFNG